MALVAHVTVLPADGAIREYELSLERRVIDIAGSTAQGLTVNGGIPGPTLRFTEGDTARIRVRNAMQEEPMWFEEGLAELVSGGSAMAMVTEPEATRAIMAGQHFFSDAAGGLVHPERCKYGLESHMFYRQAEMFVAYLQSLDGTKFQSLLLALADGHDFEGSWRSILGFPLHDAWQQFMGELETRERDPLIKEQ